MMKRKSSTTKKNKAERFRLGGFLYYMLTLLDFIGVVAFANGFHDNGVYAAWPRRYESLYCMEPRTTSIAKCVMQPSSVTKHCVATLVSS
jgi:hypothetical protein